MEIARLSSHPLTRPALLYVAWLVMFFTIFFNSWVSEDAYITLRVVDNFVHGYGLRWNVHERVQVYTHPLWLLLHLPLAMIWNNLFHVNILLSLLCSAVAVGIVLLTFRKPAHLLLIFCVLPLLFSKAVREYTSSGLETSLSYLLLATLFYALVHWRNRPDFPFLFSLLVALLLLNRLDHLLLVAPLAATVAWQQRHRFFIPRGMMMIFLGALPLLGWLAFSLFYYGFLFPNTKYAKLDTGLPIGDYLGQGAQYVFIWLTHDTLSVVVTIAAISAAFLSAQSSAVFRAIAIGLVLNLAYVVTIGGDYMQGRFFAVPCFVAIWLITALVPDRLRGDMVFAALLLFITAFTASQFVRDIRDICGDCIPVKGRVTDARYTFGTNSLFKDRWPPLMRTEGEYKFAREGRKMAGENPPPIKPMSYVGMSGFYAGPNAIIIDELALGDALLARLPADERGGFFVGHYRRNLPKGYMEYVREGKLDEMDANLAEYVKKLRLITEGDLWSRERFLVILRFNLGEYDHYKHDYIQSRV